MDCASAETSREEEGGLLKPVLLLATSRLKRVGSGDSHMGEPASAGQHGLPAAKRMGSVGQGTSRQRRSWLWQHCSGQKHETAGPEKILSTVHIYS